MQQIDERLIIAPVLAVAVSAGFLAVSRMQGPEVAYFAAAAIPPGEPAIEQAARQVARQATQAEPLLPPKRPKVDRPPTQSVLALSDWFAELKYDLEHIREKGATVPPAFLASLPPDLGRIRETQERKRLFFQAVLPLILRANQEILADRKRLWRVQADDRLGRAIPAQDRLWLRAMAEKYETDPGDLTTLLRRVDIVPPSLALAQAAEESGWGTSRFARQGNAIFGQWTMEKAEGLVPLNRDEDKDHLVRRFKALIDSVRAYMANLNTHRAYRELRQGREALRRAGDPLNGLSLARFLNRYSQRGDHYVDAIRDMIQGNELNRLDDARLAYGQATDPEA
ncbi:MAG: glucosaminidase domain-containing protein [Rhodospirillaceae bacterium]